MDFAYEVFPKVFSVNSEANISIRGLHCVRTFEPHQVYAIYCFSKINKDEEVKLKIEADKEGYLKFRIPLHTKGEYLIDIYNEENKETILTTQYIFAASSDLAKKRAYKGDLHIHTTYSDGKKSPLYMAIIGKKLGFDFISITDHDKYYPSLEAIRKAKKMNLNLLIFPGEEVSVYGENEEGIHLLSLCASSGISSYKNNSGLYEKECQGILNNELKNKTLIQGLSEKFYARTVWNVKKIRQMSGYAIIAHPYWVPKPEGKFHLSPLVYNQLLADGLFDAVEVLGDVEFENNILSVTKYYEERINGKKIPIAANSDTHDYPHTYGNYWTVVFAEKLEKESIFNAILNSKSVACEYCHNKELRVYGSHELVEYTYFLQREFFPLHDEICTSEGELSMHILEKKSKNNSKLVNLRKELDNLYQKIWAT